MLAQLAVILGFLVLVVHSKHLHIGIAPLNVLFARRRPTLRRARRAGSARCSRCGPAARCSTSRRPTRTPTCSACGKIEDFTWKGFLDMATCTECGRCQSQCPAWATGKPLSPKMVMLDLRDHAFAKAPYILAGSDEEREKLPDAVKAEAERPLVGDADANGVIDPDVLWSCTNCGACVEECPVDIEHIDHITDMRRYQVLIESAFPPEAASMLKNLENKGNPWGMGENKRTEWITELDFEVPVVDGTHRRRRGVPVLGGLRGRAGGPGEEDHQGHRPAAAHGRASASPCSARPRPAPATRPGGWATSSSTACWRSRTSRR